MPRPLVFFAVLIGAAFAGVLYSGAHNQFRVEWGAGAVVSPTPRCGCPELTVQGPTDGTHEGDRVQFSAILPVDIVTDKPPTYSWTVSGGRIVSGGETPFVAVDTLTRAKEVSATVRVSGIHRGCDCVARLSAKLEHWDQASQFGSIHGRVVNVKGKALAGIQVYLTPAQAEPVMTDGDGYYDFVDLPVLDRPDKYRISVKKGWAGAYVTVDLRGSVVNQAPVLRIH